MECRLCLNPCRNAVSLFQNELYLNELISKYLNIKISENDEFSLVCSNCLENLESFHNFFQMIQEKQEELEYLKNAARINARKREASNFEESKILSSLDNKPNISRHHIMVWDFDRNIIITDSEDSESDDDEQQQQSSSTKREFFEENSSEETQEKFVYENSDEEESNEENEEKEEKYVDTSDSEFMLYKDNKKLKLHKKQKRRGRRTYGAGEITDQIITKNGHLKCDICNVESDCFKSLVSHFRENHDNNRPYAVCCAKRFYSPNTLADHIQTHTNPELFKCELCEKVLGSRYSYKLHKAAKHSTVRKTYTCNICDKRMSTKQYFRVHVSNHENQENISCETCEIEFKSKREYNFHLGQNLKCFEKSEKLTKQCPICKVWYPLKQHSEHMKIFHASNHSECHICKRIFTFKKTLRKHMLRAHASTYSCHICKKPFRSEYFFKVHMVEHDMDKKYASSHSF